MSIIYRRRIIDIPFDTIELLQVFMYFFLREKYFASFILQDTLDALRERVDLLQLKKE